MRSEKEMMNLIVKTAVEDDRIRGAYISGSRVNPNVPRDIFQDYDVVYLVRETEPFRKDRGWIDRFGERLYMQYPEDSFDYTSDVNHCYGWLMQLADGNRLDLHVCTMEGTMRSLEDEKIYKILLDKDGLLPPQTELSDRGYWVQKPTQGQFSDTCNEFWWCLNNVAKGLWRGEVLYAMDMINFNIRPMLRRLMEWRIGMGSNFSVSVGKSAKYMKQYVPAAVYEQYLKTYSPAETEAMWNSVLVMCDLFQQTAVEISESLGFAYDLIEAKNSRSHLEHVKKLPGNAKEIYD